MPTVGIGGRGYEEDLGLSGTVEVRGALVVPAGLGFLGLFATKSTTEHGGLEQGRAGRGDTSFSLSSSSSVCKICQSENRARTWNAKFNPNVSLCA